MEYYREGDRDFSSLFELDGTKVSVAIDDEDGSRTWVKHFNSPEEARKVWTGLWQAYSDEDLERLGFNIA